ncbi:helix-turn-helix domain-containing protein [Nocardioides sp. BP30]|uniref:PucR family transcriptional regulator n=1 Tax=Nocardioides sp. BP30 TaxID=3036374 RepID=UPI0024698AFC|nr:helix-turn-helix domain-containing protein [Nocardioides sp. BP30]WGL53021.1 helix-turn-helix domain-containing protein [Nocardioides sp. BP30]
MTNLADTAHESALDSHLLAELERRLNDRLPDLLLEVRDRLAEDWPDYATFLESELSSIEEGAGGFLHGLLAAATTPSTQPVEHQEGVQLLFEQIGHLQWQAGQDLPRLLTAYQLGARVAWRHVSEVVRTVDLPSEVIAVLAERLFDFVNHLSQASTTGYLQAQGADSRTREHHREDLADLLLSERASVSAVRAAADRARWRLPEQAAVVLIGGEEPSARDLISRLDSSALPVRQGTLVGAIVADPRGRRRDALRTALAGVCCVVGISVPIDTLARSLELTQLALRMRAEGVLHGTPVFVDDHLDTIIVHRDDRLLSFLRAQVLAPLDGLPAGASERLTETLVSWLRHHGDRLAVAAELHVHPQTVSYRLGRLRDLFGEQLDSPRERSRLLLALGWG